MTGAARTDVGAVAAALVTAFGTHLAAAVELDRRATPSFPYAVYQDGLAALQVQHLIQWQSTNVPLKAAAQQVTTEQTSANAQVRQLAQARGLALPVESAPHALWRRVDLATDTDGRFDQRSIGLTLDQYDAEIATVTDYAQRGTDAPLRSFAQALLPVLDAGAARARLLAQQLGVLAAR